MITPNFIPVYKPSLLGNEKKYVNDCLDSTWISSKGKYIDLFETQFKHFIGVNFAAGVCNGTVAIHLALVALGISAGDEVIVPTLTYIASVNPIVQVGAKPIFVDSHKDSWQLDEKDIERKITPRTKAIMVVHLYGHAANMDAILKIANEHNLMIIEDCAEAFGTKFRGQHVGTFGDIATFSFFGNKTITTGEGGMVVTNDATLYDRICRYRGQGLAKHRTYWHDVIGFNYRMTNICAAIGLAQLERANVLISQKRQLAQKYDALLTGLSIQIHRPINSWIEHSFWMYSILVKDGIRDKVIQSLFDANIETRPVFYPVHTMPMYAQHYERHKTAEEIARRGINLPSWPDISDEEIQYVAQILSDSL